MIELKSRRSARSTHYQISDTKFACRSWSRDKFYYNWDARGDGEVAWRKIDTTLVPNSDGWSVEYAPIKIQIPKYADGTLLFLNVASNGTKNSSHAITSSVAALHVEGVASGNEVIYTDAFGDGSDLIHRVTGTIVSRFVRVRAGKTPQAEYRISFSANGLTKMQRGISQKYDLDRRGPKVTDSESYTSIEVGGEQSFIMPFLAFTDTAGSARTASVVIDRKSDTEFDIVKTVPNWWDGAADIYIDDSQSVYADYDGDVYYTNTNWATCRGAATGALATTGTPYMYSASQKSGVNYFIYRCFVSFPNTVSALATIDSATVTMYSYGTTGGPDKAAPFEWTTPGAISNGAYNDFGATQLATEQTWPATNSACTWTLNASGLALVPKTGTAYYCFRDYTYDILNVAPVDTDNVAWKTMDTAGTSADPYMTINYTLPSGGTGLFLLGVG